MDVKAVVLPVVVSDGLGLLVEPELLLSNIVSPSLEDHVCSTKHLSDSIEWKLRHEIEWSVDVETEFLIQSLGLSLNILGVDNLPSLVGSIVSVPNLDLLTFVILTLVNIKAFAGLLDVTEVFTAIGEDLPPSRVGTPNLHVVGFSRALNIE